MTRTPLPTAVLLGALLVPSAAGAADPPASSSSAASTLQATAAPASSLAAFELGVSLVAPERQLQFREERAAAGVQGPGLQLSCRNFAESLSLCFSWQAGDDRRWVTTQELSSWGVDLAQVEQAAVARAAASLSETRPQRAPVADMDKTYLVSMEGDGLDVAGFVAPDALSRCCGASLRVAVPAQDVFLAWPEGDDELDAVMAIGVARTHEAATDPVTANVFTWDAQAGSWVVWGQARR